MKPKHKLVNENEGISNIIRLTFEELIKKGYKPLIAKDEWQDNDLICLTTKAQDLWAIIYNAEDYRKKIKNTNIGFSIALRKK